jgi:ATP-dependent Clp protease ATP-binding subunit ClpC
MTWSGLASILPLALVALLAQTPSQSQNHVSAFQPSSLSLGRPLSRAAPAVSSSSFLGRPNALVASKLTFSKSINASNGSRLSMAIDRMSDQCIEAVKAAHDIGNDIGLSELKNEILFAGIVNKPERAAKTLERFELEYDDVRFAAIKVIKAKPGIDLVEGGNPEREALPFSEDTKATLARAVQIADRLESQLVRSEHVLLALFGYNNGQKIVASPVVNVLGEVPTIKNGKNKFSVFNFCEELVNVLPNTPIDQPDTVVRENVVIGGTSGNLNTLKEVGVDMTQLALDGKLDMVFGRDKEIRTALRTLGRRRKNNPCLIGDPGKFLYHVRVGISLLL